jgi:DNA-binding NarL/FixJ family response regulator
MSGVRVLVVDDHPVVRAGMRSLLDARPEVSVVGEAATGEEAVTMVAVLEPELVLMDLQLGDGIDGVEATRRLLRLPSPPRVLIVTTFDSDADILPAIEAGASGYLLKDALPDVLAAAIVEAARGDTVLAPSVAARLVERSRGPEVELTSREIEVIGLVSDGLSNREVGDRLFIGEATVKTHLVHVFSKLDATSRTAAVAEARRRGLVR